MKVLLTMELDIPESYYKDDEEDRDISIDDLPKLHIDFVKEEIFRSFVNFANCKHLEETLKWMVGDSPFKQEIVDDHKRWSKIIQESEKTIKITPLT